MTDGWIFFFSLNASRLASYMLLHASSEKDKFSFHNYIANYCLRVASSAELLVNCMIPACHWKMSSSPFPTKSGSDRLSMFLTRNMSRDLSLSLCQTLSPLRQEKKPPFGTRPAPSLLWLDFKREDSIMFQPLDAPLILFLPRQRRKSSTNTVKNAVKKR